MKKRLAKKRSEETWFRLCNKKVRRCVRKRACLFVINPASENVELLNLATPSPVFDKIFTKYKTAQTFEDLPAAKEYLRELRASAVTAEPLGPTKLSSPPLGWIANRSTMKKAFRAAETTE